jgi:hypothetical protein
MITSCRTICTALLYCNPAFTGDIGDGNDGGVCGGWDSHDGLDMQGDGDLHGRASLRANHIARANVNERANDIERGNGNEYANDDQRANDAERANDNQRANWNEHADDSDHAKSKAPVADNNDHSNHPRLHRKPKSLSSFIIGYKSTVTTRINNYIDSCNAKYNKSNRLWQPNFYDHVIRNDEEYLRIKEYIQDNPSKWKDDSK